jgi:hypothetical protein
MRFPQVGERMREAPAHALRAMFAGIGQVLLVADRMRSRPDGPDADQPAIGGRHREPGQPAAQWPSAVTEAAAARRHPAAPQRHPAAGQPAAAAQRKSAGPPAAGSERSRWRSLDQTGNVRILPVEYRPSPAAEPTPAQSATAQPSPAEPAPAALLGEETAGPAQLPVPNYDALSLASLRARLRNLDAAQVRQLLDYEKANAARPDLLTMYERRLSKLETGQG